MDRTSGTGVANLSHGILQGLLANMELERAQQELEMRVALPSLIQERREERERQARKEELQIRYAAERESAQYQRETTLITKKMDIDQRKAEAQLDAWVQMNKPKGDQGKSVSLSEAQSVASGVERRFTKRFPKNWDKQQSLVESLQEYKALPPKVREAMISGEEITPPQFAGFVAMDKKPRTSGGFFGIGKTTNPYSDQDYLLGSGFKPVDYAQGAATESVLQDLNLEMLPGVLAGGSEESVLKAVGQLANQWGDSVDVRTQRNMDAWNAPDTLVAPVIQNEDGLRQQQDLEYQQLSGGSR
jgi:hypothetical protein